MDLNFIYLQQQVATICADTAPNERNRSFHQLVADDFGRQIAAHQHKLGAAAARSWTTSWTTMRRAAARAK